MKSPRPRVRNASRAPGGARSAGPGARLFPRRGRRRPSLLDLSRRALSRHRHACLVPARTVRVSHPCVTSNSPATSNFSFLRGASHPEELMAQAAKLALDGLGLCDRNSVAGVVRAHVANRESGLTLAYHPGARLVFSDGTPDVLASRATAPPGEGCAACSRSAIAAPRRATAF